MSTPEVRVRLSPEGIKEVIAALRAIQGEAGKAAKSAAGGVSTLTSAVRELKTLLPAIGLAAAVGGFIALTRQALATADATGKLQQKVGGTVEEISGLTLAFRQNQSDQEGLQQSLLKTASFQADVAAGNEKALETLRRLGIEADAFTKLSTPRALEDIAKKLAGIPPSAGRAAAAADIFGEKVGGKLIIALNAVGEKGIDPFIAKARELGVLIDSDLANAAARANDALDTIKIQAEGIATQFASGFAPAVAGALEEITGATTGTTNGFKALGQAIGFLVKGVTLVFVAVGKSIGATTAKVVSFVRAIIEAGKAIAKGDFAGAAEAFERSALERAQIEADASQEIRDSASRLFLDQPEAKPRSEKGTGEGILPSVDDSAKRTATARAAFIRQQLQAELKLQQEGIAAAEEALKRGYDRGVLSLKQFYEKRRELIQQNIKAEIAALRLERQAVLDSASGENAPKTEAERIKLKQDLAKITNQIRIAELQGAREIAALEQERFAAAKALRLEQLDLDTKLNDLEGKRHEVFQANLQREIEQVQELGKRAGQTAAEIQAQVDRLTTASTAKFNFEEVTRQGEAALSAFNRDADQIRRDQEAGVISQVEGEMRLIELEAQRLVVLKELAAQLLIAAEATGSPEQIARAQEYAASIDQIAASYRFATDAGAKMKSAGIDALESGFENLLLNADKIKNVGDAFKQLAQTVLQSLARIAADILAKQAIFALLRAFGGGAGGGGFSGAVGAAVGAGFGQHGGRIRGYAGGGDIRGTALNIPGPDKIPIMAQAGEFMVKKTKVMEPGALDFLRAWNGGQLSLARLMSFPRFATGGQIGPPQGTPPQGGNGNGGGVRIINLLDENLVSDGISSASGERAVLNVISKNSTTIKRQLGGR